MHNLQVSENIFFFLIFGKMFFQITESYLWFTNNHICEKSISFHNDRVQIIHEEWRSNNIADIHHSICENAFINDFFL